HGVVDLPRAMTCLLNTMNRAGFHPASLKPNAVPAPRARGIRFAIDDLPNNSGGDSSAAASAAH
ncbi:MAG: hypothetical protein VB141_04710, partial [Burkholderia gladioli]